MPLRTFISNDLPAPEGPRIPTNSFGWIESEIESSSVSVPPAVRSFACFVMLKASTRVFERVSKTLILSDWSTAIRNVPI
jgi:hypothetical protein